MTLSFTGHRPDKLWGYNQNTQRYKVMRSRISNWLKDYFENQIGIDKIEKCITGMAIGFDQLVAECCIEWNVSFEAYVPFVGQESMWPKPSQEHYMDLLSYSKKILIVSEGGYEIKKMQIRNERMVDDSDLLIACWNGTKGGTKNCIDYAIKKRKQIVYIPKNLLEAG